MQLVTILTFVEKCELGCGDWIFLGAGGPR